jgi:hypothetical protein
MGSISAKGKAFPPGIHVPSLTWFQNDADQEIDWDQQSRHIQFLVNSGLDGSKYIHNFSSSFN